MENTNQPDTTQDIVAVTKSSSNGSSEQTSSAGASPFSLSLSILVGSVLIASSILFLSSRLGGGLKTGGNPTADVAAVADQNSADVAPAAALALGDRDVILGDKNAPVTLIAYGDYQCPFCYHFFKDAEPSIRDAYVKTGKVKMVFRGFQFLGTESDLAGQAAECAKDQGKFWLFHDALYNLEGTDAKENNGNLTRTALITLAANTGLDATPFANCLDSKKYEARVKSDTAAAQSAGVNSTPTIFVNSQKLAGALPFAQFQAIIEAELKK